jgi:hypothetical protein
MRRFSMLISSLAVLLCGCASYTVPGGPGKIAAMELAGAQRNNTDPSLRKYFEAKPLATFPAMLATARIQSSDYESRTAQSYGRGAYSVITTRDVEGDDVFDRIAKLPGVKGVAPLSRMLLPPNLQDDEQLRAAAARVQADILVIYTFDTQFYVKDFAGPVTVVTLGLSPNKKAYVTTTSSAILLDTRSGYVYGGAEATAKSSQLANGWTSEDAVDDTRLRTEKESFEKMVADLEKTWPNVVKQYGGSAGSK